MIELPKVSRNAICFFCNKLTISQLYDNSNKYHVAIAVCRGEQVLAQRLLGFDLFRQNERLKGGWDEKNFTYPLVMTNIAMQNQHL